MKENFTYYIAYGSNLNKTQMKQRCPGAKCVGSTYLKDYKLRFNLHLTIQKCEGEKIPVGIWQISKEDEVALDIYEEYPSYYRKEYLDIEINGTIKKCLVYIMIDIKDRVDMPPTEEYLQRCIQGYKDFNFDLKYLKIQ